MRESIRSASESSIVRALALIGLLSLLPINQVRTLSAIRDYDIWLHTRVGHWILQTHSFPRVGLFSRIGASRPWAAYSWGFETIMAGLQSVFGLLCAPLFAIAMDVIIVFVLFTILSRLSGRFWWAWLLTYVAIWGADLNWIGVGRPVMFSILFFSIELGLILLALSAERRGETLLYWLPLLFVVWANCHIEFVNGLAVLGLLAVVVTAQRWVGRRQQTGENSQADQGLRPGLLWGILSAAFAATLLNPYGIGLYRVIYHYAVESRFAFSVVAELKAMSFRRDSHFVELLLAMMAFFAMGRRKVEPFKLALLIAISVISFRSMRDAWFLCIAAAAVIASSLKHTKEADNDAPSKPALGLNRLQLTGVFAGSLCIIFLAGFDAHFNERRVMQSVQNTFPLGAVTYIEMNHPPGPLFNQFDWGGFLIATLPDYPVSIDGRTDLYGDDLMRREANSMNAIDFEQDPAFNQANLILLPASVPLCRVLERSPRYNLVYADQMAMVFVRRP